jgi:uncharacterized protein (DUF305 family)
MREFSARTACLAAVALPLFTACGGASRSGAEVTARPAGEAGEIDYDAIYRARQDSARTRFTEADVAFVTGMIAHHAQALVVSAMAPTHGASASLRTLAARITISQQDEIEIMQRWLRDRGQPVPELHISGTELTIQGGEHIGHVMPGMLTAAQIRELDGARGPVFDRLFLTYMIRHHEGAVTMVTELFGIDGALQDEGVFKLASDIQVDQLTEIARMETMLATLPAGDPTR